MLCPVVKASKIQTQRRKKRSLRASQAESEDDESQPPSKKLKLPSSDPSTSLPQLSSATKNSACGNNAETVKSTNGPDESKVINVIFSCLFFFCPYRTSPWLK